MQLKFSKYEGAGNDFILIDTRHVAFIPDRKLVARLCDRHFGVGADGVMTLSNSHLHDCSMRYFNADGSPGEMCGNGGRCFVLFAHHLGLGGDMVTFDSLDGDHTARLIEADSSVGVIELGMIDVSSVALGDGWWSLNTGVPHYVEFVDNIGDIDVVGRGRAIRNDLHRFPQGTNVNFVQILGPGKIRMRTYERGVEAETLACGTGATAAAIVTSMAFQSTEDNFLVEALGGELRIAFEHDVQGGIYHNIRLSGGACRIFTGNIEI